MYQINKESLSSSVVELIAELDSYQNALYPAESNHCTDLSALANDDLILLVVRDQQQLAVGCGALLLQPERSGELKRIYIRSTHRGQGLAVRVVAALEQMATHAGLQTLRLETGIKQQAAISLYQKLGYQRCAPFPPYQEDPLSLFMTKNIA